MSSAYGIKSDEKLNSKLKKQVQGVRGGIMGQIETTELNSRFRLNMSNERSAGVIMDTATGKSTDLVPLFALREVLVALSTLFES